MTTHELAKRLLDCPNVPVEVQVQTPGDTYWSGDITIRSEVDGVVVIDGWMGSAEDEED